MGVLAKALSAQSSYAAKKTDLWPELLAMIENCMFADDVDAFERHVMTLGLQIPAAWEETIAEMVEKKREQIAQEDIGLIMRERYDFT